MVGDAKKPALELTAQDAQCEVGFLRRDRNPVARNSIASLVALH